MPRILEFGYLRFTFPAAGVPPPHRAAGHGVPAPAVPGRAAPLLHPNKHGPQLCNPSSRIKCIFNWIYLWKNFIGWFETEFEPIPTPLPSYTSHPVYQKIPWWKSHSIHGSCCEVRCYFFYFYFQHQSCTSTTGSHRCSQDSQKVPWDFSRWLKLLCVCGKLSRNKYMSQMLYAGQSAPQSVTFLSDF